MLILLLFFFLNDQKHFKQSCAQSTTRLIVYVVCLSCACTWAWVCVLFWICAAQACANFINIPISLFRYMGFVLNRVQAFARQSPQAPCHCYQSSSQTTRVIKSMIKNLNLYKKEEIYFVKDNYVVMILIIPRKYLYRILLILFHVFECIRDVCGVGFSHLCMRLHHRRKNLYNRYAEARWF